MKRRNSFAVAAALLAAVLLVPSAVAARPAGVSRPNGGIGHPRIKGTPNLANLPSLASAGQKTMVFVQLSGRPVTSYEAAALATADDGAVAPMSEAAKAAIRLQLQHQQTQVRSGLAALGVRIQASFTDTLNGFRLQATAAQLAAISRLPGVTAVYTVPELFRSDVSSDDYIGATSAWTDTGVTGAGVKIAIIDTGINYYHKNFGGSGNPGWSSDNPRKVEPGTFPTAKVIGGYDFVGDKYDPDSDVYSHTIPKPDKDPLDCKTPGADNVQHGSHVAGIAAGEGVLTNGHTYTGPYTAAAVDTTDFRIGPGVAPRAKLLAYRVLGCSGGTYVVLDAIERAVRDGADVINMSLGSDLGNPNSIDSIASNNASAAGVTVVASAGNGGPSAYITGSPAAANRVISVAAMDGSQYLSDGAVIDFPGVTPDVGGWNMYESALPASGTMDVLMDGPDLSLGCSASDYSGVTPGDIVAISRGTCAFSDKRGFAQDAGASAVVLVNNVDEIIVNPVPDPDHTIPMISAALSDTAAVEAGDGLATTIHAGSVPNPALGSPASFTSSGPRRYDSALKPDVSAPGVDVVSTDGATVKQGKSLSGTSMASPTVAGAAALLLQAHPGWTPAHVKGALVGTADPSAVDPYDVRQSAAGVIDVPNALSTVSWAESSAIPGTSSLAFGYQQLLLNHAGPDALTETQSFRLRNSSGGSITYDLSNTFNTDPMGLDVSMPATVTVPAHSAKTVNVTISMSEADAADLPDAAPGDAPVLDVAGTEYYVPLLNIAGAITADPESGGPGHEAIEVPWILVPHADSSITEGALAPYASAGKFRNTSVTVKNRGVHDGNADVFAWGLTDQDEGLAGIDLRAGGVQSLPAAVCDSHAPSSDRCLIFAVNTWGQWSSGADGEFDVLIDEDHDGVPDFAVIGVDYEAVFGPGFANAVPISLVLDLRGASPSIVDVWFATAPPNGSTLLLPVMASELDRSKSSPKFQYWVESYYVADDSGGPSNPVLASDVMLSGNDSGDAALPATFNAYHNPISNGDFVGLAPGDSASIDLSVNATKYFPRRWSQKGWMIVNLEDPNGAAQADLVHVGQLP
jgi:minor extracellular serine protease Vpr